MRIILLKNAEKQLRKLPRETQQRIFSKFSEIESHTNPLSLAKRITACKIGTYRFRVGDYRIIFRVQEDIIQIGRIGHRDSIYK